MATMSILASPMTRLTGEADSSLAKPPSPTSLSFSASFSSTASASAASTTSTINRSLSSAPSLVTRYHRVVADAWSVLAPALAAGQSVGTTSAYAVSVLCGAVYAAAALVLGCASTLVHVLARHILRAASAVHAAWHSPPFVKQRERVVKRVGYEMAVTVLGPHGNGLLLFVLWPGWLVLGAALGLLQLYGW